MKDLQKEKQKLVISLGHRRKRITTWQRTDLVFALGAFFQARIEGERRHCYETFLRYVQKAPDDIRCSIDRNEFDELMATKKNSLQVLTGFSYSLYKCARGLGSQFLFKAYKHVLEGGAVPALFAESSTVFIRKSFDVDNNGRIVRSLGALRPLTLCKCDCEILTTAICRGLHWYTMR